MMPTKADVKMSSACTAVSRHSEEASKASSEKRNRPVREDSDLFPFVAS